MNKTPQMNHAEAETLAKKLVARLRKQDWSDEDIVADLLGLAEGVPAWRRELLAALAEANGIPFNILCAEIGVGPAVVMARRRKDKELEQAVANYMGAYFEDEASIPTRGVSAGVVLAGLERHAHGWKAEEGRSLSDEDVQKIIRAMIDSVRLRVKDKEVLKLIGEDIASVIKRAQGS